MTAASLLAALHRAGAEVRLDDDGLAVDPVPPNLEPPLCALHTGIRATLAGKKWFGCGTTKKTVAARELNPCEPIPPEVELLAVEGDLAWDRIRADARLDQPGLFVHPKPDTKAKAA